jgi:reductive dehalogenase
MTFINLIFLFFSVGFFLMMLVSSWKEREKRALAIISIGLLANTTIWIAFLVFPQSAWLHSLNFGLIIVLVGFLSFSLVPFFPGRTDTDRKTENQYDERHHMFSRNNLKFHPEFYRTYYAHNPENEAVDKKIHSQPELGDASQHYFDPLHSPIFDAAFSILDKIRPFGRGKVNSERQNADPELLADIIKKMARYYGAVDAGIAAVEPYHLYSHAGRHDSVWGKPVHNSHKSAIVIVVAMDVNMMKQAPALPAILESSRQYVEAAKIAFLVAEYLRILGYDARAHTDGNYETLCVPLAVSSGMGELGRMGILVHKIYGPCVRLSVVTTDLELPPSVQISSHISQFCNICKKCADNCPTRSITPDEQPSSRGFKHWSVDQERCFSFWKNIGTDCGFCIRVCPYTKPDTFFHRLVRFYISRNFINQRIALLFDDLLYGRKQPIPSGNPKRMFWTQKS